MKPVLMLGNLAGPEGNAFVILGRARKVALANNMDWIPIERDATSGDYDHLLNVIREHFDAQVEDYVATKEL